MKKINIEGLEGKALETAQAFNSVIESLEQKQQTIEDLKNQIEEMKKFDSAGFEKNFTELKSEINEKINDLERKSNSSKKPENISVVDGIVSLFEEKGIKSFKDLESFASTNKQGVEFKAAITSASLTGDVSRTQEVSMPKFAPTRPLALVPIVRQGTVDNGKSVIMWTPMTYTDNTGYVGENSTGTENQAAGTEKYRQMAKISAKQYITAETLEDIPQFAQRLNEKLRLNAITFLDQKIIDGAGNDSTKPNEIYGLISQGSTAFDSNVVEKVQKANIADLIDACATQAEINLYTVDTVLIHPKLANKLRRTKDADGQYIINKLITGEEVIGGLRVIRTTAIDSNALFVFASQLVQLWIKRNLTFKVVQTGTDEELDRYTAIIFMRAQVLVEDDEKKGVIYVSDVSAAVQAINEGVE